MRASRSGTSRKDIIKVLTDHVLKVLDGGDFGIEKGNSFCRGSAQQPPIGGNQDELVSDASKQILEENYLLEIECIGCVDIVLADMRQRCHYYRVTQWLHVHVAGFEKQSRNGLLNQ